MESTDRAVPRAKDCYPSTLTVQLRSMKGKVNEPSGLSTEDICPRFHKHSSSNGLFCIESSNSNLTTNVRSNLDYYNISYNDHKQWVADYNAANSLTDDPIPFLFLALP